MNLRRRRVLAMGDPSDVNLVGGHHAHGGQRLRQSAEVAVRRPFRAIRQQSATEENKRTVPVAHMREQVHTGPSEQARDGPRNKEASFKRLLRETRPRPQ